MLRFDISAKVDSVTQSIMLSSSTWITIDVAPCSCSIFS